MRSSCGCRSRRVETPYRDRPQGSQSKLRTFRDGFRILRTIVLLVKEERPLQFFSLSGSAARDDIGAARLAVVHRVSGDRTGAAAPDGDIGHGPDDPRVHERRRRPRPRHGDARAPRAQAAALPRACGARPKDGVRISSRQPRRTSSSMDQPTHGEVRREFVSFAAVGVVGFAADAALFLILTSGYGWSIAAARSVSASCSIATTWKLNRHFTFTARRSRRWGAELARYAVGQAAGCS